MINMENKKQRYVIRFDGLFEYGYFKPVIFKKTQTIKLNSHAEAIAFAKKYRFKWWAEFVCRQLNWLSKKSFDLRTFKVEKL